MVLHRTDLPGKPATPGIDFDNIQADGMVYDFCNDKFLVLPVPVKNPKKNYIFALLLNTRRMNRFSLFKMFLFLIPICTSAQKAEITPFGGYVFPGTMNANGGEVRFLGNAWYGGMVNIGVSRVFDADLIYTRIDTKADINIYHPVYGNDWDVPLSINYFHVGFTKKFPVHPVFIPFTGMNIGTCLMAPKEKYREEWFLSLGIHAGAKAYVSNRVGFRLEGRLMVPIQGSGFNFFAGSGGSGGGVSVYSTMVQFGLDGGLVFRLGKIPE